MVHISSHRVWSLPDWRTMNVRLETIHKQHIHSLQRELKKHREVILRLRFTIKALVAFFLVIILTVLSIQIPQNYTIVRKPIVHKATMAEKKANRLLAEQMASAGWGWTKTQWQCADKIFMKESRYDQYAKNQHGSTAFGIGQVLSEKSTVPAIQIARAYKYIEARYGSPCRAYNVHKIRNWY